jgi:hypothetical protein
VGLTELEAEKLTGETGELGLSGDDMRGYIESATTVACAEERDLQRQWRREGAIKLSSLPPDQFLK